MHELTLLVNIVVALVAAFTGGLNARRLKLLKGCWQRLTKKT